MHDRQPDVTTIVVLFCILTDLFEDLQRQCLYNEYFNHLIDDMFTW